MDDLTNQLLVLIRTHGLESVLVSTAEAASQMAMDFQALGDPSNAEFHGEVANAIMDTIGVEMTKDPNALV